MKSILVIEDDENIRESLIELLETRNYNVVSAESGTEGLILAQDHKPSLIVCDVMMAGISGYDVVESIRKDGKLSHIPFIFLSAKAMQSDIEYGIKMGANYYLTKPFKAKDLFSIVDNLLKNNNEKNSGFGSFMMGQIFTMFFNIKSQLTKDVRNPIGA